MTNISQFTLLSALVTFLLQPFAAMADDAVQDLTTIAIEDLVNVEVITASRLARQVSDAPSAVVVVTAQDIKDYGYRTLADILNSMRGLHITNDHAYEFLGGRGFSRPGDYVGRVLLLIDGYASNDNLYNQTYIDNSGLLDTELIERVEYIPGTGSVLYGNNAYFGIVSVTTKKGRDVGGTQVSGEVFSQHGRKGRVTFGDQLKNGADVLLSASWLNSDGDKHMFFPEFNAPATNNGIAQNLDFEQSSRLFAKLGFENVRIEAGFVSRRKAVPTTVLGVPFNAYNLFRDINGFLSAHYDADVGANLKSSTHAYTGYYLDHSISDYTTGTERLFNRGQWWGVDQKLVYTGMDRNKWIFGAEYRDDFAFDFSNLVTRFSRDRQTFSLYAQDEFTLNPQWVLNLGARYDLPSDVSGNLSPRVAVIYLPTPQTTLKAVYSTAFRMPAAIEKFNVSTDQVANARLKSEHVTTTELVLKHEFEPNFSLTGSLYHYTTEGLIDPIILQPSGLSQYVNSGSTSASGLELEVEKLWQGAIRLRTSYSYHESQNVRGQADVNAPQHMGKFNLSFPLPDHRFRSGIEVHYIGSRLTELRRRLGGYTLANITVTADHLLPNLSASASLRNVFDKQALIVAPDELPLDTMKMDGRNFWMSLTYDFK